MSSSLRFAVWHGRPEGRSASAVCRGGDRAQVPSIGVYGDRGKSRPGARTCRGGATCGASPGCVVSLAAACLRSVGRFGAAGRPPVPVERDTGDGYGKYQQSGCSCGRPGDAACRDDSHQHWQDERYAAHGTGRQCSAAVDRDRARRAVHRAASGVRPSKASKSSSAAASACFGAVTVTLRRSPCFSTRKVKKPQHSDSPAMSALTSPSADAR